MRNEVNTTAIHDRVTELKCDMPSQEELNKLLNNTEMLKTSSQNPKAYSLTNLGIDYAENIVNSHIKKNAGINFSWEEIFYLLD